MTRKPGLQASPLPERDAKLAELQAQIDRQAAAAKAIPPTPAPTSSNADKQLAIITEILHRETDIISAYVEILMTLFSDGQNLKIDSLQTTHKWHPHRIKALSAAGPIIHIKKNDIFFDQSNKTFMKRKKK